MTQENINLERPTALLMKPEELAVSEQDSSKMYFIYIVSYFSFILKQNIGIKICVDRYLFSAENLLE